jgi:hypothetical protein
VSDDEIRQYLRDIGSFDDFKSVKDGTKEAAAEYAAARNKEELKMGQPATWVVRRTITGPQAGTFRVFKYKREALPETERQKAVRGIYKASGIKSQPNVQPARRSF